jgi:hypothetical protein
LCLNHLLTAHHGGPKSQGVRAAGHVRGRARAGVGCTPPVCDFRHDGSSFHAQANAEDGALAAGQAQLVVAVGLERDQGEPSGYTLPRPAFRDLAAFSDRSPPRHAPAPAARLCFLHVGLYWVQHLTKSVCATRDALAGTRKAWGFYLSRRRIPQALSASL